MDARREDSRKTAANVLNATSDDAGARPETAAESAGEESRAAFDALSPRPFADRHIGPSDGQIATMLGTLGLESLDALVDAALPADIRTRAPLDLPGGVGEAEVLAELREIAAANRVFKSFVGLGYYGTHLPPVIQRNVLENPAWYTAYTPYQPEISQGRLEALFVFQTLVSDLTALPVANASLLDEATAAAEAMTLCRRVSKSESMRFFVSREAFPQTIEVLRTRAAPLGYELVIGDHARDLDGLECFGALFQYPGAEGGVHDYRDAIRRVHERGGLAVVAADLLAMTLLTPPGELGADVAVGSTQRFGVPLGFGGPHASYMSTREELTRQLPGRLVGLSIDRRGEPAYRLAIQTREQHIRREKATSNICTAQVLLAVIAAFYACYHGPQGLRRMAARVHRLTAALAAGLGEMGVAVENAAAFDTLTAVVDGRAERVVAAARERRMNLRKVDADRVGVALDETTTPADVEALWEAFAAGAANDRATPFPVPAFANIEPRAPSLLPPALARRSAYLTHPVFNRYESETEMLRYIRRLSDKDLALDRTMIPLGSCTMKLNAAAEMLPISWPGFNAIHPFAPAEQTEGYRRLTAELERMLCACTGYDAVSLQPNAGSQGEYSALLAIRAYHASRGDGQRDVCLIPSSAHGTNPASAHLAGLKVVVVACDADGNVDVADLRAKAVQHASHLAAFMLTYPSTHGVFESAVRELCSIVHKAGGQVFIDGANLNAMVGLAKLAEIGGDASHLNLHKTFCIPHGGGGPGVGPVAVKAHLAPFLPGHALAGMPGGGAVSAAPYGSASILPISWAYIRLMGGAGLRKATQVAILNANYVARRLAPHYPVLYTGQNGLVAHECVLDLRPIKQRTGITVDDVAKRLIDFGFHAPTISFPVAGTLMIEPTESESLEELDRFCDAMIKIREEIEAVAAGASPAADNPLVHAPHTARDLVDEWQRAYTREQGVFPLAALRHAKYWPPVARVDNVYGDRHLVCACPPIEAYASEDVPGGGAS
ncbi:MAG TPA: aminomethyl-transferring glycine dehydrogenase [Gammaproteobacteria bacterium]|nr:aminomethyl-transferring glycine dehydrogenase [Gammaproteobacteria bacterium]